MLKLRSLKGILNSEKVILYLEDGNPIKFDLVYATEYIRHGSESLKDEMYQEFGDFEIEQIYGENEESINIDLANK